MLLKNNFNCFMQYRLISYAKIKNLFSNIKGGGRAYALQPPYDHIVQIGDPLLRSQTKNVPREAIKSKEIQLLIKKLKSVLTIYNCVGLSAPQIGVNLSVFLMEFNKKHRKSFSEQEIKSKDIQLFPLKVFINPQVKIVDFEKVNFSESCESVKGFHANVQRFKTVEIKAFDEKGEEFELKLSNWLARITQHEMDHLKGTLFTDVMDRKSLSCSCWQEINKYGGRIELPFGPP